MKERPILFSGEMVRAILDGRKTQTRRVVKPQPTNEFLPVVGAYHPTMVDCDGEAFPGQERFGASDENEDYPCPYGQPADRLWVKETFWKRDVDGLHIYNATGELVPDQSSIAHRLGIRTIKHDPMPDWDNRKCGFVKRPSIYMPRWLSRITLEIVSVRVERLQEISEIDAMAEGVAWYPALKPIPLYKELWETINGDKSWSANPWVWVIEFKKL